MGEDLALSYAQERLWFIDQMEPGSTVYNIPSALRLEGSLQIAALGQALQEVIRRHEVLRTGFVEIGGRPRQLIKDTVELDLGITDLTALQAIDREECIKRLLKEENSKGFDLATGKLTRASLLRVTETEQVLMLTMHHIVSDGWSSRVMMREVGSLYESFVQGHPSPLGELQTQYVDYAAWQKDWLNGEVLQRQVNYWKQQLTGAPEVLDLPTDKPRPALRSYLGARQLLRVPIDVTESLERLSRRQGVTLYMVLLSAFKTLLYRYSGQNDILVGSAVAGRTRLEIEPLIGFFVNTLVLRTELNAESTFEELLEQMREIVLQAHAHQELPFEKLVEELQPERSLSHAPLFQVMVTLDNTPGARLELPGLRMQMLTSDSTTAKFDLTLGLTQTEDGMVGSIQYNRDLFEAVTIQRMVIHYQHLLREVVNDPERTLGRLSLLSQAEQYQLLVGWNDTATIEPEWQSVAGQFEHQVEVTPDAIALVFEDECLSYRELNARANQLAHHLGALGIGLEKRVGICVDRSLEMIVGVLGILKAGGAYLPLDPKTPAQILETMIADGGVSILLTQTGLRDKSGIAADSVLIICLDSEWGETATHTRENPVNQSDGTNLGYVMYTSGSTGKPKGVCVSQGSIVRLVKEVNYAELSRDEIILQLAPISFDASTLEIWGSLLNGGRLVMAMAQSPTLAELGETLNRYHVTTLWLTAGLFHLMVDERIDGLRPLRQLLAGGDALSLAQVEKVLRELPDCQLINGYGPTESTTFACCNRINKWEGLNGSVSIGRPISHREALILDLNFEASPIGVSGELYIGGEGLARGYLNEPSMTAERFVPNRFSTRPGARLYKTGDMVRYRPGGEIEFQGRNDFQVKVRGYRIEMGEIEAALAEHDDVREVVVIAQRSGGSGDKRIVAYLVANEGKEPSARVLREFLEERLPSYKVPSVFVKMDSLPLTANGKVDRRALPKPDQKRIEDDERVETSRTPAEELMAGIWSDVLGYQQVGINQNFFDLGGHSLLATQIISRVRSTFDTEVPLRWIFESPTVAGLAARIEDEQRESWGLAIEPLVSAPRDGELSLSYAQERLWFIDQMESGTGIYNIPVAARLDGALHVAALVDGLREVVRRHEVLRTGFIETGGRPQQVIGEAAEIDLCEVDLMSLNVHDRDFIAERLLHEEGGRGFDLPKGNW